MSEVVEELQAELHGIDAQLEAAALAEDQRAFVSLSMRKVALPYVIREARARPVREEVQRLEQELAALDDELRRAKDEPAPQVPVGQRGRINPAMAKNSRLANIANRASSIGRQLRLKRRELQRLEAGEVP